MEIAYDVLLDASSRKLYDSYGIGIINETGFSVYGYQDDLKISLIKKYYSQQYQIEGDDEFGGIITYPLQFQLIDFMNGAEKVIKSIQTVPCYCPRGGVKCAKCRKNPFMTQIVEHTVHLPPGAPEFHRIFVRDLGDNKADRGACDVVFIAQCSKHPSFERYKSNLYTNLTVSLYDVLNGSEVEVKNIDEEILKIPIDGIKSGDVKVVKGKGLPILDANGKRGDLMVTIFIEFPKKISNEQKKVINEILPDDISEYN
ncbi:DnaJ domain containing protein [Histomonas meleagridis]|uniref:DnaJ domain containing protein n=1 Tax=Histomonas meleagridis TaxID=135588 RepID=UPI00355AC119|nr:DnaJ domain containing protein [Histomonas meleagridis]KAH0805757.1 DnaJ domain containing protein [Histomonas meleagridis]